MAFAAVVIAALFALQMLGLPVEAPKRKRVWVQMEVVWQA